MTAHDELTLGFDRERDRLQAIAYRMLGSVAEAEDAVQETWLRLARADLATLENPAAWLTTVLSRICLDMLRARRTRREELTADPPPVVATDGDPEAEALLVDAVGRALLVVLDRLGPEERIAFVLHDALAVPFARIAPIVDRSLDATKQLASRARRKVRGHNEIPAGTMIRQRAVAWAFLAASRSGDLDALLAVLTPDGVRRADRAAVPVDRPLEVRGARRVAEEVGVFGRNAGFAAVLLVDGAVGIAVAPHGRLRTIITLVIEGDRVAEYAVVADPVRLAAVELAILPEAVSGE